MVTILIKYNFSVFNAHMLIMLQYSISYSKPKPFESQSLRFKRDIELTILYQKKDLLKNNVTSTLNQSKHKHEHCLHDKNCELCILLKAVRLTLKFDWSLEMHF